MPNTVSRLKQLFKEYPIFPQPLIDIIKQDLLLNTTYNLKLFQTLVCTLPEANRKVLETLLSFMNQVVDEKSNLMGRNQVAMAMLPSMQAFQNFFHFDLATWHVNFPILRAFLSRTPLSRTPAYIPRRTSSRLRNYEVFDPIPADWAGRKVQNQRQTRLPGVMYF